MKTFATSLVVILFLLFSAFNAHSATLDFFSWGFLDDGALAEGNHPSDSFPSFVNSSAFNNATQLGTLSLDITGSGAHAVFAYFDYDIYSGLIDDLVDFDNDWGDVAGTPAVGQTWYIEWPNAMSVYFDDLHNGLESSLPNFNMCSAPFVAYGCDIAMALGWNFTLLDNQQATVNFILSDTMPSDFHLIQGDPLDEYKIYLSSNMVISAVPEPSTMRLLGSGLFGFFAFRKKFKK